MADSTSVIADLLLTQNTAGQAPMANDLFNAAAVAMLYAQNPATTTGLTWGYIGGWLGDNQIANGTVALTDDDDNYIVADRSTGVVSASTGTTNWDNDTDYIRLYEVTTDSGAIDEFHDRRQAIGASGGGGGGISDGDKGDVTVSSGGTVWTIDNDAVTFAKMQDVAANSVPARAAGTSGDLSAVALSASQLLGRGDSGDVAAIALGTGLVMSGTTLSASGGGGGLTDWTDGLNSSSPNSTVPVASLAATNAATNVDAAILPKGSGSLLAAVPDGTTTGGNKRGTYAVDLQLSRSANTGVAAGNYSGVLAGRNNRAAAQDSVVAGGVGNTAAAGQSSVGGGNANQTNQQYAVVAGGNGNNASGISSAIGGGSSNAASQSNATVAGGDACTASAAYASVLGGYTNTASGNYSAVTGGRFCTADAEDSSASGHYANTRSRTGVEVRATGRFSAAGDAQIARQCLRVASTDASGNAMTSNGSGAGANNQLTLANNSAYHVRLLVVARSSSDVASFEGHCLIYRGANAASTTIQGSPTIAQNFGSAGASAWTIAVTADTTNGALRVTATGAAATNIKWVAQIDAVEVVG